MSLKEHLNQNYQAPASKIILKSFDHRIYQNEYSAVILHFVFFLYRFPMFLRLLRFMRNKVYITHKMYKLYCPFYKSHREIT